MVCPFFELPGGGERTAGQCECFHCQLFPLMSQVLAVGNSASSPEGETRRHSAMACHKGRTDGRENISTAYCTNVWIKDIWRGLKLGKDTLA